ncbi:unnamed protein product [Linum tenue]|uniref:Uncharacterized protein n=1 Tax=Linum tenue TaxID=586396 RepID=A0AAV0R6D9_9ROSI|nr:unnamed protein product [Linum tenue]
MTSINYIAKAAMAPEDAIGTRTKKFGQAPCGCLAIRSGLQDALGRREETSWIVGRILGNDQPAIEKAKSWDARAGAVLNFVVSQQFELLG